jgi:hypothetical protein
MQYIFTHVNTFYHSLVSAACRGRIISLNSTPTMRGADCPTFLAMTKNYHIETIQYTRIYVYIDVQNDGNYTFRHIFGINKKLRNQAFLMVG